LIGFGLIIFTYLLIDAIYDLFIAKRRLDKKQKIIISLKFKTRKQFPQDLYSGCIINNTYV